MSYCVHCGVELNPAAKVCPLCQTPAWQPETSETSYFPTKPAEVKPVSKWELALILTAMLASVAICSGVLNLILRTARPWSLYVIGAAVMLWIWFVLPLLFRRLPAFLGLTMDIGAIGIYVYLISIDLNGATWFVGLALPILGVACAVVFVLSFLLRGRRRSIITSISLSIAAIGLFAMGVELFCDLYFHAQWLPGWSLVTTIICVALIIPLVIVRRVPALREEARRRFNL
ncbi:MAG: DUF6320 domain-containing protein [Oscillibacter sp.]